MAGFAAANVLSVQVEDAPAWGNRERAAIKDLNKKIQDRGTEEEFKKVLGMFPKEHVRTVVESLLINVGTSITTLALQDKKLKQRLNIDPNKELSALDLEREISSKMILNGTVIGPVLEEALYRLAPSFVLDRMGEKGMAWMFGIPIGLIFHMQHNIQNKKFHLNSLVTGVYYWYLQRKYGFYMAALGHVTNNTTALVVLKIDQMLDELAEKGAFE